MLLHFWARQNPVSDTAECAKVAPNTAVDAYQWLREVCSTRLINDGPVILGGPGVIVYCRWQHSGVHRINVQHNLTFKCIWHNLQVAK